MHSADPKLKWHLAALVVLMLVLGVAHTWVNPWLRYDREAIEAGQLWRLWTCHLVHLNLWHALLNLTGLTLCGYFFSDLLTRRILWLWLGVSSTGVGAAFYLIDTHLGWYVGLSGILHGLLVICLLVGWRGNPWLHSFVLLAIAGRLFWEQMPDYNVNYLRDVIDGRVYVNAHLYGSLFGVVIGGGLWLSARTRKNPEDASA